MKPTYQSTLFGEIMRMARAERRLKPKVAAYLGDVSYSVWMHLENGNYP